MGVLPQFEIIVIPGACGGVWRYGGSDFNLKLIPNTIFETNSKGPRSIYASAPSLVSNCISRPLHSTWIPLEIHWIPIGVVLIWDLLFFGIQLDFGTRSILIGFPFKINCNIPNFDPIWNPIGSKPLHSNWIPMEINWNPIGILWVRSLLHSNWNPVGIPLDLGSALF